MTDQILPSWREGSTRAALLEFLAATDDIPYERRLAVFDNDGTLWCEKPNYPQLEFFAWALRKAAKERPALLAVPELAALAAADMGAMVDLGLDRVALAVMSLFEMQEPEVFEAQVHAFFDEERHPSGQRFDVMVYQPMLELMGELAARGFTNCIVTGGGTEFVRAISRQVYGVDQERVVGTLVTYVLIERDGRPTLVRTNRPQGEANEGAAKISNIQMGLGRRPSFAAGNSPGDAEMLEYANATDGPSLALLVNHDDAEREFAYESRAGTFLSAEPIGATAERLGWLQVSMRDDWTKVFAHDA